MTTTAAPRKGIPRATSIDLRKLPERPVLQLTLRQLAALYLSHHPSRKDPMTVMRKWCDAYQLGEVDAWSITRDMLQAGCDAMLANQPKAYKPATINHNLSVIGSLYKWADKKRHTPLGFVSPTRAMHRLSDDIRRIAPARPGEWDHIRALARSMTKDPRFQMLVWLVMDSGARRGEVEQRTWAEFDIDSEPNRPHVVLYSSKTEAPRCLYFSLETAALIRKLRPAEKYRHLKAFASKKGSEPNEFRSPWKRLVGMLAPDRKDLHVHDLRHMVAAGFLKEGRGLPEVANLLGHSSDILRTRYGHLDDANTRKLQADRLGLDEVVPEFAPVAEARIRQAEREASAPADAAAEVQRLQLVVQEAMAALAGLTAAANLPSARRAA